MSARPMSFPLSFKYFVLVVNLVTYSAQQAESLYERKADVESQLNDFELKLLRDFVRRKGKGSVSRVPFKDIFLEHEENAEANFPSNNAFHTAGQVIVGNEATIEYSPANQRNFEDERSHVASRTLQVDEEKIQPDFERLAKLLKKLADRRKNKLPQATNMDHAAGHSNVSSSSASNTPLTNSTFFVIDSRPVQPSSKMVSTGTLRMTRLESIHDPNMDDTRDRDVRGWALNVQKNATSDNDIGWLSSSKRDAEWEMKMQELTRQLSIFLSSMKRHKEMHELLNRSDYRATATNNELTPPPLANIHIIREHSTSNYVTYVTKEESRKKCSRTQGSVAQRGDNEYELVASTVLVSDNGTNILVDTGLGTDRSGRMDMLKTLSNLNIKPRGVHYVVTTHGHPHHSGNTNDFPDALHYAGNYVYRRTRFNFSHLYEDTPESLTRNVYLIKTPGHSSDDISVIVNNANNLGTVAISGDIFIRKEDLINPEIWTSLSTNETQQRESRRRLICLANYIVPGHGDMFAVTESIRKEYKCVENT